MTSSSDIFRRNMRQIPVEGTGKPSAPAAGACSRREPASSTAWDDLTEREAFEGLLRHEAPKITAFLSMRANSASDAQDLAQEVFIRAWSSLRRGTQVESFGPWVQAIARNVLKDYYARRGSRPPAEALDDHLDLPDTLPSQEKNVTLASLFNGLLARIDQALSGPAGGGRQRDEARLRKLAFVSFYVDHCSLAEIRQEVALHAGALGLEPPSAAMINNWLSRGDILSQLIRHLVDQHPEWVSGSIRAGLAKLEMSGPERKLARLRWVCCLKLEEVAARSGLPMAQVQRVLDDLRRRLVPGLTAQIKAALHQLRSAA
ncbi:MAG: sigma-70 family RNA polymerase sigma factor [Pseudomonadota bacterium]